MSVSSRGLALAAVAALSLAGADAVAQTPAPSKSTTVTTTTDGGKVERRVIIERDGPGGPHRVEVRGDGRDRDDMRMGHAMRRSPEERAEHLRTLLQLTPAQNGALAAYIAATAPPEPGAFMQGTANRDTPPTAVERADRAADMAGRMATEARKRADATRAFYAALTPSQRKVFDTTGGAGGPMIMRIREARERPPMPPMPPMPPRTPG